ncbi:hypothetical protein AAFM48_24875 [Burkholderia pseudomallei]
MMISPEYSKNIETSTITLQSDRIPFDEIIFPVTSIKPSSSNLARQIKPRPTDNRLRLLEKSEQPATADISQAIQSHTDNRAHLGSADAIHHPQ